MEYIKTITSEPFKITATTPLKFLLWGISMGIIAMLLVGTTSYRTYKFWRL